MAATAGPDGGAYVAQHRPWPRRSASGSGRRPVTATPSELVFCSRSGPPHVPWLEPDVNDRIEELAAHGVGGVVVVPIGFVSDHMEVIYDLDTEASATAEKLGVEFARAATAGARPPVRGDGPGPARWSGRPSSAAPRCSGRPSAAKRPRGTGARSAAARTLAPTAPHCAAGADHDGPPTGAAGAAFHDALLDLAVEVAVEAAEMVRRRRREGVEVSATKSSPVDIVTEVDKAAERLIFDRLMTARPDDGFLGEEGGASESTSGVLWIVDPIDGTVNFLYGIPHYAVSIAAAVDGRSVAGVVVNVQSGELYTATSGGGAFLDGERLRVREGQPVPPLSQRLVGTGFNYVADVKILQTVAVSALLHEVRDIRRMGSAALDLCAVAAGRVDAFVEEGLNSWDMAAGGLVATEAGALLEQLPGVGGTDCVVCAPEEGYEDFRDLVERSGFLRAEAPA